MTLLSMQRTNQAVRQTVLLLFLCIFLVSCNTILGPPGSEPAMMEAAGAPFPHRAMLEGQPDMSAIRAGGGYYLWRNGNTWHVRVAKSDRFGFETPGQPTIYSGSVRVETGVIVDLQKQNSTLLSDVRLKQKAVVFRFDLRNDVEGFDFSVRPFAPEYCLTFDLKRNKEQLPDIVHLGRSMFVPEILPLVACVR
jgi:hypothetical protein